MVNRIGYVESAGGSKIYVNPNSPALGVNSEVMPAAGLTEDGRWIVIKVNADGTLPAPGTIVGVPHFEDSQEDVTPGVEQTLLSGVVPAGLSRMLIQVLVVTRVSGCFSVIRGSDVIGSGRTGPGCSGVMQFSPQRPISSGTAYQVIFKSRLNAPVQSVECYLQATDQA